MNESSQGRTAWIDILKGIAIIFVVLGHNPITTTYPKIFNIVFSFHVPLFFFISGYLFNPNTKGGYLCKKRFNSLLRPYIFTVAAVSLTYIIVKGSPSPIWYIFWAIYANGPNLPKLVLHLWFLPGLFSVTLLTWLLFKHVRLLKISIVIQLLMITAFLMLGFVGIHLFWNLKISTSVTNSFLTDGNLYLINGLLDNPSYSRDTLMSDKQFILNGLPWSLDVVLISTAFFISGYFVKRHHLDNLFQKSTMALILLLFFALLHYFYDFTIDLNTRRYDNFFICTLLVYAGIYFCTYLAQVMAEKKSRFTNMLQYIGQNSIIIYIFHPIMQIKVYNSISLLLPNVACIAVLLAFVAGISLPLVLNYLLLERFKFVRYWYYAK